MTRHIPAGYEVQHRALNVVATADCGGDETKLALRTYLLALQGWSAIDVVIASSPITFMVFATGWAGSREAETGTKDAFEKLMPLVDIVVANGVNGLVERAVELGVATYIELPVHRTNSVARHRSMARKQSKSKSKMDAAGIFPRLTLRPCNGPEDALPSVEEYIACGCVNVVQDAAESPEEQFTMALVFLNGCLFTYRNCWSEEGADAVQMWVDVLGSRDGGYKAIREFAGRSVCWEEALH